MPKRKISPKRLTPQQVAELQAVMAKILETREKVAAELRPLAETLDTIRGVRGLDAFSDVAVTEVAALVTESHTALQKKAGRATGACGGRPTKLPTDWKGVKAQHSNWNQKKLAFELKVSESTLRRAQKKDRS